MGLWFDFAYLGLDDPAGRAKFEGIYAGFLEGIRAQSCRVTYSGESLPNQDANVVMLGVDPHKEAELEKVIAKCRVPIILNVPLVANWFPRRRLERWNKKILFVHSVDAAIVNFDAYASVGIDYHYLPGASNPRVMRPLPGLPPQYDIVFVGALGHKVGRYRYLDALMPRVQDRKCLFIGDGWGRYGLPNQLVAWGDFLNAIYNLGRVCINIHFDDEKQGREAGGLNVNYRLFDYALAGCFQVSDNPEGVYMHFLPDEVVAVEGVDEWVERILYYLDHPEETRSFQEKARQRALREHTWHQRAAEFVDWTTRALDGAARSVSGMPMPRRTPGQWTRDQATISRNALKRKLRVYMNRWRG